MLVPTCTCLYGLTEPVLLCTCLPLLVYGFTQLYEDRTLFPIKHKFCFILKHITTDPSFHRAFYPQGIVTRISIVRYLWKCQSLIKLYRKFHVFNFTPFCLKLCQKILKNTCTMCDGIPFVRHNRQYRSTIEV